MGSSPDARLRAVAARQHWAFTRRQALTVGVSRRRLDRLVRIGAVLRLHRAVFCFAGPPAALLPIAAAVLACGPAAVASHRSAALLWGVDVPAPPVPEVIVPHARQCAVKGVRIRRATRIEAAVRSALRVTAPMRTLLDLASVLTELQLEIALDDFVRRGLIDINRLRAYLADRPRTKGTRVLRALVAVRTQTKRIGGGLETKFFAILRGVRLPIPVRQHPVLTRHGMRYIDFAYVDAKVAIEVRDYDSHTRRAVFDDDAIRKQDLEDLGWRVIEVTWTDIERRPDEVVLRVARVLRLRPVRWR